MYSKILSTVNIHKQFSRELLSQSYKKVDLCHMISRHTCRKRSVSIDTHISFYRRVSLRMSAGQIYTCRCDTDIFLYNKIYTYIIYIYV